MNAREHRATCLAIGNRFTGRWERGYVRGKLRVDPLYPAVARELADSDLPLLDIGCGMGLLGHYLAASPYRGSYLGIDSDPRKIASARRVAPDDADMQFVEGNAGALPAFSGNVAILDALHYMPASLQQAVLQNAAERVASDGKLLIRNCLRDRSWRYWATVLEEKILHASSWMQVAGSHIPSRQEVIEPLAAHGLDVSVEPLWGRTPYNSYFLVAHRPG